MATDHIFQEVEEFVKAAASTDTQMFQEVLEVVLGMGSPALTLACPSGGTTATVGVFYDEFLQVTGGTPPYFFEII